MLAYEGGKYVEITDVADDIPVDLPDLPESAEERINRLSERLDRLQGRFEPLLKLTEMKNL